LVTCIAPLFLADRLEGHVLEASHLALEQPQVHEGFAAVVVPFGLFHTRARDAEDRHPPAVGPPHLDAGQVAPAQEPQGPKE
jgi:hypothetical protein